MYKQLLKDIQNKLSQISDFEFAISSQHFFKNPVRMRGIRTPKVYDLARNYFKQIDSMNKSDVLKLCNDLMATDIQEDFLIAYKFLMRIKDKLIFDDFVYLQALVLKYVNTWVKTDTYCNHIIGNFMERFPGIIPEIKKWAKSSNLWVRRASAVSFILLVRHGKFIDDVFEIADILLLDSEDIVQKGYGWALKVVGMNQPERVYDFVMARVDKMPRTAYRYAIEKLSSDMRKKAMKL